MLNVVDICTRECIGTPPAQYVANLMERASPGSHGAAEASSQGPMVRRS